MVGWLFAWLLVVCLLVGCLVASLLSYFLLVVCLLGYIIGCLCVCSGTMHKQHDEVKQALDIIIYNVMFKCTASTVSVLIAQIQH